MDVKSITCAAVVITAYCLLPTAYYPAYCQIPELPPVGGGSNNPAPKPPLPPNDRDPIPPPLSVPPSAGGEAARLLPPVPAPGSGTGAGSNDLELVEKVIEARRNYANSLKVL